MNKNECAIVHNKSEITFLSHLVLKQATFDRLKFINKTLLKPVEYNITKLLEKQVMLYFKTSLELSGFYIKCIEIMI